MQPLIDLLVSASPFALALLKATVVLGIVQLAVSGIPRLTAAGKHLLLVAGISGFLLFPIFSLTVPGWELPLLPSASAAAIMPTERDYRFLSGAAPLQSNEVVTVAATRLEEQAFPAPAPSPAAAATGDTALRIRWMSIGIYAWMTVTLLLLSRVGLGLVRVWWIIRTGEEVSAPTRRLAAEARRRLSLSRDVRLLSSDFVEVPMICGFFQPTVLLPVAVEDWPEDQLQVVLLHEFAHLKRWDALTLLLTNLVTSLFWFHPQVWFASQRTRRECERACDDLVLGAGTRPSDYAGHLLSIVKLMPEIERFGAVTLAMSQRSQLEGRLLAILHPSLKRGSADGRAVIAAIVTAALLVFPLAAARLTARATTPNEPFLSASLQPESFQDNGKVTLVSSQENDDEPDEDQDKDGEKHKSKDHRGFWYSRGYELHKDGRYDEAIGAFQKSIGEGKSRDSSMYNIACGYALKGDSNQAMAWLNRALDAGFDSTDHLFEDSDLDLLRSDPRFRALLARYDDDKYEEDDHAREKLSRLRRDRSTDGDEWYKVGSKLLSQRQLDESILALHEAVRHLGYRNENALYNLACALALKGDPQRALETLERAINAGYDGPDHMRKDRDLASLRTSPRFKELVDLAEDLSLHNHQSERMKNEPQFSKRRWASTVEFFDSYVRSNPQSGRAWFNLGYAQHYSSDHQQAIDSFTRSARLGYREPTALYNIACAYARMGETDAALQSLERSEKAGFALHNYIFSDDDLESLHSNPRFLEMAARVAAKHGIEKFTHKLKRHKKSV